MKKRGMIYNKIAKKRENYNETIIKIILLIIKNVYFSTRTWMRMTKEINLIRAINVLYCLTSLLFCLLLLSLCCRRKKGWCVIHFQFLIGSDNKWKKDKFWNIIRITSFFLDMVNIKRFRREKGFYVRFK